MKNMELCVEEAAVTGDYGMLVEAFILNPQTVAGEKMMKELVEYLAKSLVDHPDEVRVTEKQTDGDVVVLELNVAEGDMGKVIGKQGRIAKAIRTVVKAASAKEDKKYMVEII